MAHESPIMEMAQRIASVMSEYRGKEITPATVDLRLVSNLCWALGVTPTIKFSPLPTAPASEGQPE